MFKIEIIKDKVFSLDGINRKEFKTGDILEVNERELGDLISAGICELVVKEKVIATPKKKGKAKAEVVIDEVVIDEVKEAE